MPTSDLKGCRLEEDRLLQFGSGRLVVDDHITKNNKPLRDRAFARFFFDREVESWEKFASSLEKESK